MQVSDSILDLAASTLAFVNSKAGCLTCCAYSEKERKSPPTQTKNFFILYLNH